MNQLKKVNAVQTTDTSNLKKLTVTQFTSDTKIGEIEKKNNHDHSNKCITIQEFNKLTSENFATRLAQVKLATKYDIVDFVKKIY